MSNKEFTRLKQKFWFMVIIAILGVYLCSCSSTRKTVSRSKSDSTHVVAVDSTVRKKIDSASLIKTVTVKDSAADTETETVFEFERIPTDPADYFDFKRIPTAGLKKITVKEKGKIHLNEITTKTDSVKVSDNSSVELTKSDKTKVVKSETVKSKKVFRFSWWWLLLLLIPIGYKYRNPIRVWLFGH